MAGRTTVAPLNARDAKQMSRAVHRHRQGVAERILQKIYQAIARKASYGERVLLFYVPPVTDTVYDMQFVLAAVIESLRLGNFKVVAEGNMLYISWV